MRFVVCFLLLSGALAAFTAPANAWAQPGDTAPTIGRDAGLAPMPAPAFTDGGVARDGAVVRDAGVARDGGMVPDAARLDAGMMPDAARPDAAVPDDQDEQAREFETVDAEAVIRSLISDEDKRFATIDSAQQVFRRDQLVCRGAGGVSLEQLASELDDLPDDSARYRRVQRELERVQMPALDAWRALWREPPTVPGPGASLARNLATLPDTFAGEKQRLDQRRRELHDVAESLRQELTHHLESCAALLYEREAALTNTRLDLFRRLGRHQRADILDYGGNTQSALQTEAGHFYVGVLHWLHDRDQDIRHATAMLTDIELMGQVLWWLLEIVLALLVLVFALRRWDGWMAGIAAFIGRNMLLGGWTLTLVRVTDFARSFGPSLLVLLTAVFIHRELGGAGAPPEIRVLYVFVFWISLLRAQQRLLVRLARHISALVSERERRDEYDDDDDHDHDHDHDNAHANKGDNAHANKGDNAHANKGANDNKGDNKGEHAAKPAPAGPAATKGSAPDSAPGSVPVGEKPAESRAEFFVRCWRTLTVYATVAAILVDLIHLATGPAVAYKLASRVTWWGLVPLGIYFVRVWRPWIVHAYVTHSPKDSRLIGWAGKHAARFYGIVVLVVLLIVVLVRQIARFVNSNLSDLDATKRLLAFLFRRRVEKHAQERGAVLSKPPDLPADLLAEFPTGPLAPEERPVKRDFLDEIKGAFSTWQAEQMEGSVVLVGSAGMGKSSALGQLQVILDEPVPVYKVRDKYTDPQALIAGLARLLELPHIPTSEAAFIVELSQHMHDQGRRVVALDNCHNFFLRKVGGFAAWETFTRIVNQTCHEVFWVMSFNAASWDYLRNIAGGVSYFRRVVHIPPWTDEELRRLILTRMRRARYRVNFMDLLVTRLQGVDASTQIIRTSQGYFRLLWDFTDGNPRVACHFWLRSLVPDTDKKRVRVHLFAAPRIEELEQLPDDIAFVLAALVEHESITEHELATVSNATPEFARFALQYCIEHGYMWRGSRSARTKLTTHWQQPIIRYLKRRHLLYS